MIKLTNTINITMINTIKILNKNQIKITYKNKEPQILTRIHYVKEHYNYIKFKEEYYA